MAYSKFPFKDSETVVIWLRGQKPRGFKMTRENVIRACETLLLYGSVNCDPDFKTYFTADGSEDLADMLSHVSGLYSHDSKPAVDWIGIGASLKRIMRERLDYRG